MKKKTQWLLVGRPASKFSVERGCASVLNRRKTRQIGNDIFVCMSIGIVQVEYYTLSCNYRITPNIWDSNIGRNSQIQSTEITEPPYLYFPKYLNHGQEFVFYLCYFLSNHISIRTTKEPVSKSCVCQRLRAQRMQTLWTGGDWKQKINWHVRTPNINLKLGKIWGVKQRREKCCTLQNA
jgi:hypothetical protein